MSSLSDKGGSLQPENNAAVILRHCLLSLSRLNHLDRRDAILSCCWGTRWRAVLGSPPPSSMRPGGFGQESCLGKMVCQPATCNIELPVERNGRIMKARACASWGGYSAVILLLNVPSGRRTPTICSCVPCGCGQDLARWLMVGLLATNIQALAQSLSNWHAHACAANGAMACTQSYMRLSSQVIYVEGFSNITKPACRSTAERRILDLSWMVELSCTASCCLIVLEGRPSKNSGVRTGAGPCGLNVALLCLQQ